MPIIFSDLNLESSASGDNDLIYDLEAIRTSIFTILTTFSGERLFHPGFGSNLEAMLFEPMDDTTAFYIHDLLLDQLTKWETRIVLDRQKTTVVANEDAQKYDVSLSYSIPALNIKDTMSFNLTKSK